MGEATPQQLREAEEAAARADVAVVVAGLPARYESEGFGLNSWLCPGGTLS